MPFLPFGLTPSTISNSFVHFICGGGSGPSSSLRGGLSMSSGLYRSSSSSRSRSSSHDSSRPSIFIFGFGCLGTLSIVPGGIGPSFSFSSGPGGIMSMAV
jgi:hypothetical protein